MAVGCFYFEFPRRKEQSAISMLDSLLKQMVGGMGRILGRISQVFKD